MSSPASRRWQGPGDDNDDRALATCAGPLRALWTIDEVKTGERQSGRLG
jgi:hypothetical protein